MKKKNNFFSDSNNAVLYLMFISLIPLISIFAQYAISDRTMYVSSLVAGFSMTYDYFILFKENTCKRLWFEALISSICLIFTTGIGIFKLISLLTGRLILPYTSCDLIIVFILAIIFLINIVEFVLILKDEYKKKYSEKAGNSNLINGSLKV